MDPLVNRKWSLNNLTLKIFGDDSDETKMGNFSSFSDMFSRILYRDTSLRFWCLNGQSPPNSLFRPEWSPNVLWNAQSDPEPHAWFNNGRGTARDSNPFSLVDFVQQPAHHGPFLPPSLWFGEGEGWQQRQQWRGGGGGQPPHHASFLPPSDSAQTIASVLQLHPIWTIARRITSIQYEMIATHHHQQRGRQSLLIKFVCICQPIGFQMQYIETPELGVVEISLSHWTFNVFVFVFVFAFVFPTVVFPFVFVLLSGSQSSNQAIEQECSGHWVFVLAHSTRYGRTRYWYCGSICISYTVYLSGPTELATEQDIDK